MDMDPCTYHFRSLKSGALVTPVLGRGIEIMCKGGAEARRS